MLGLSQGCSAHKKPFGSIHSQLTSAHAGYQCAGLAEYSNEK
ncbi:hypothetical protein SDC9_179618 [bioreactor metagenome]|uniref:Uncharacterized protein n=1 Tax=bioreactor metagenome TaxID=1076179 RepID=A0A645H1D8_9ZZZZ